VRVLSATALTVALFAPGLACAQAQQPAVAHTCTISLDAVRLANPLTHVAQRLGAGEPITIVAIGSSSTAGAGASSPALSYPSRLLIELGELFPRQKFNVINRGVNGEEAADMLKRFDAQVVVEKPDLVLWQLGTNSVIRDHVMTDNGAVIRDGVNILKQAGADVVLVDPQFAPKVIVKPEVEHVVDIISGTAKAENVGLFHRFSLMKHWHHDERMAFEDFVSPDGLHMNDWSYGCLAKTLAAAIAEAATRPVASASAAPRR
jgi:acyl-CoA thioesterase-1